jgi:hypothetical protein
MRLDKMSDTITLETNMIYTLDYLEKQAQGIQSAWNGEDDRFMYEGDIYHESDVEIAKIIEEKITEIKLLAAQINL